MSYRNDHDAALARIDALEAELGQSRDARARFASLEQQLAQAKRERDRALAEGHVPGRSRLPVLLGILSAAGVAALGFAASHAREPTAAAAAAPIAVPVVEPAPPTERTKLLACVDQLDGHIAGSDPSSKACLLTIDTEVGDRGLGTDIHQALVDWQRVERDGSWRARRVLAPRIHAFIIPSFTR